jgi:hypothetical protein
MTMSLARTTDRAFNPTTGRIEPRTLVYAAVLARDGSLFEDDSRRSQILLVKGPAMPYFAPASREVRSLFELDDYEMVKECAIALLVYKVEKLAHKEISKYDADIEVWGGEPHIREGVGYSPMSNRGSFSGGDMGWKDPGVV